MAISTSQLSRPCISTILLVLVFLDTKSNLGFTKFLIVWMHLNLLSSLRILNFYMLCISLISSNTLIFIQQPNLKHRNLPFLVYKKMVAIYAAAPRSMDSIRCLKHHSNRNLCILRAVQLWISKITPNHNISTGTVRRCFIATIVSEMERLLLLFFY